MNISICLNEISKIPMWFFESPANGYSVHLTLTKKGPEKINFSSLSLQEKGYIMASINNGSITCDTDIDELNKELLGTREEELQERAKMIASGNPLFQKWLKEKENYENQQREVSIQQKAHDQHLKQKDRAKHLSTLSLKGIRSGLRGEKQIAFINMVLEFELEKPKKKQRNSVISYLNEKKKGIQRANVKQAMKESKKSKQVLSDSGTTMSYNVKEEGKSEIVEIPVSDPIQVVEEVDEELEEEERVILPKGVRL